VLFRGNDPGDRGEFDIVDVCENFDEDMITRENPNPEPDLHFWNRKKGTLAVV
jgi:hypothetical protein